ncbi:MAG: DNA mismatch repair endonuclease MutL [Rhodobacterales bacterium]|nr:DNA mismatch repair endonuclease MutL [Rhodobacterales bacterium]
MAIRILEEHVVNQIAAGEVVERPASVLRELLQNSLDAEASSIRVSLRNGGMALVRVADDGVGMNRTDAMMCLERHATSKINVAEDLHTVATLGFRGEALPSIAAVCRFELRTRSADTHIGTRLRVEGGTLRDVSDIGCAPGTEIDVRSLFYNLLPRRKFLRTKATELNHCLAAVTREALIRPQLDIRLHHDERELLSAPSGQTLAQRAATLLGDAGKRLLPVEFEYDDIRVVGLSSPIGVHRSNAGSAVYLYVNGRYVQDRMLRRAVYDAYRERVPRGRYPVVVLNVQIDPRRVDVNVHPTKVEVRFGDPRGVNGVIAEGLRQAVGQLSTRQVHEDTGAPRQAGPLFTKPSEGLPVRRHRREDLPPTPTPVPTVYNPGPAPKSTAKEPPSAHPDDDPRLAKASPVQMVAEPSPSGLGYRTLTLVGALPEGRALCARGADLVVVDVYAARQILLLKLLEAGEGAALGLGQRLLVPLRVSLPQNAVDTLVERVEQLATYHIDVDRFSARELAIRGLPRALAATPPEALLSDLAAVFLRRQPILRVLARHGSIGFPVDDLTEIRTLFASLQEQGIEATAPAAALFQSDELARRLRGGR